MGEKLQTVGDALGERLPELGILAFSLCSTWSLFNLFTGNAAHPTPLYWLPSILVELVTAWVVSQIVQQVRELTKSNISKQDRRFFGIVTGAFSLVALPLVALSVWANSIEFDNILLGAVFPVSSIGCAIGSALPETVRKHREARQKEREAERKARAERRKEKEAEREARERRGKILASVGNARETFGQVECNPVATQAQIAESLGISRRTVGNHLEALEQAGAIRRNGDSVEILI